MSIEDASPVCLAISQYLTGASSTINWRFFGNAVRAMAPGTAADKIPFSRVPDSEMKAGKPKDVFESPWCDGATDYLSTLGKGFVEIHLKVFGGAKARQDEMKQMVRLMQQGARGSPAHQQATVDFARRFAKGLDKAKGDYVDGGQSTGDFSALLVHPSNNKVIAEFDPPLTSFVSQHHRILFLRSVEAAFKESEAQLDASTEGKAEKRPRATSPPVLSGGASSLSSASGSSGVKFAPIPGPPTHDGGSQGRRAPMAISANDWTGTWTEITGDYLRHNEIYFHDIRSKLPSGQTGVPPLHQLKKHVASLTFESLGVAELRRDGLPTVNVAGNICLAQHVLGRQCKDAENCSAAANHNNHIMRLSAATRAEILKGGGILQVPKRV